MTAGKGITHSERTPFPLRAPGPELSGIQTWLALPKAKEELDPAFEHVPADRLPVIGDGAVEARIIMGTMWGTQAPVTCHSETIYGDVALGAGASVPVDPDAEERAVYLAGGDASLDGIQLEQGRLYVLRPGIGAALRSERGAHVMICGGAPMDGPRHVWWNFVSSNPERIAQAKADWKAGRFALPPDDKEEFIPLPEVPMTVSYP
jgi:redox-sensitive bicupin YhaK (pirin superfamily)